MMLPNTLFPMEMLLNILKCNNQNLDHVIK